MIDQAISPDGKDLVYIDSKGLHLSVIATGEVHDLLFPELPGEIGGVRWYPDGEKLLLNVFADADSIWETSIFGGAPRKLREHSQALAISPHDSSIAIIDRDAKPPEISIIDANGGNFRKAFAVDTAMVTGVTWSPDGRFLAYTFEGPTEGSLHTWSLEQGSDLVVRTEPTLLSRTEFAQPRMASGRTPHLRGIRIPRSRGLHTCRQCRWTFGPASRLEIQCQSQTGMGTTLGVPTVSFGRPSPGG